MAKLKAYKAFEKDSEFSTIVFAKNRTYAKLVAMNCDCCEHAEYIDIRVQRWPEADHLFTGLAEIDWNDPKTRVALVRDLGWSCIEPSWECDTCQAKPHCGWHEEDGGAEYGK